MATCTSVTVAGLATASFVAKGFATSAIDCSKVNPNDVVNCYSQWNIIGAVGASVKAEHKIRLPTGAEFKFYSALTPVTADGLLTLSSEGFTRPIPSGNYSFVYATLYDASGNTIAGG